MILFSLQTSAAELEPSSAQHDKKKEEQRVTDGEADGEVVHQGAEVKGAGDWLKQHEEGINDWPRERVCHTHERAIPIQQTVEALDITEEGKWNRTVSRLKQ